MQHYHAILTAPFGGKTAPGGTWASLHSQHLGIRRAGMHKCRQRRDAGSGLPGAFSTLPTRMDALMSQEAGCRERPPSLAVGGKTAPAFSTLPPSLAVAWPKLGIRMQGAALCAVDFVAPEVNDLPAENPDAANVVQQLMSYFSNPAYVFSVPLAVAGTPFQQRVWQALREVPVGQPCRYGDLARHLSSGPRAVGSACRANPLPIVVPCHRVVSATGLGGYSGVTKGLGPELAIKRWLLDHERG